MEQPTVVTKQVQKVVVGGNAYSKRSGQDLREQRSDAGNPEPTNPINVPICRRQSRMLVGFASHSTSALVNRQQRGRSRPDPYSATSSAMSLSAPRDPVSADRSGTVSDPHAIPQTRRSQSATVAAKSFMN